MINHLKNIFHIAESLMAEGVYKFPSKKIRIIGVTGTDGKTTTTHAVYHILKSAGKKVSMISSIYADIGGKTTDTGFHTTTPRPWKIRKFLKQAVDAGSEFFVLETTSHALDQGRVWGIKYEVGLITNITHEHLLYHRTFEDYMKSKLKLLQQSKISLVNKDDSSFAFINQLMKAKRVYTYSLKGEGDFIWEKALETTIVGEYNRYNILAAYSVCKLLGLSDNQIFKGIKTFKLPLGRLEIVYDNNFMIIVDFAHTPNAIEQVLKEIRKNLLKKDGRIIHVFGSASERDDSKRPIMGRASATYSDIIILTEEDYRREDISHIWSQISEGLSDKGFKKVSPEELKKSKSKVFTTVKNRGEAIDLGITLAKKHDIVVATGKSHEKSLNRDGVEEPWDEYKVIKTALDLKS